MRILIINPNTTQAVTARVEEAARAAASPGTSFKCVTASFGPAVISSRAEDALAAHGALEAAAANHRGCDAAILGASWDTALAGLRELLPIPVVGLTESAITIATLVAERFALVTVGPRAAEGHRRLVAAAGLQTRLAGIGEIDLDYASILGDADAAVRETVRVARDLVDRHRAEAIIPTGAVFAALHRRIQAEVPVPVLDATACAVQLAEALVRLGVVKPTAGTRSKPPVRVVTGVDPQLAQLFRSNEEPR